ncbi:hypothetical protein E2C01_045314 [Portunus trituberculatus]|uniref:Uncharacterized protein n=1 Tax=Portunus trituberculatus TaxID=210409 RepID=A0A5B7G2V0_PORTR|nr:hypothetical protein [Portunus trituberculatus]
MNQSSQNTHETSPSGACYATTLLCVRRVFPSFPSLPPPLTCAPCPVRGLLLDGLHVRRLLVFQAQVLAGVRVCLSRSGDLGTVGRELRHSGNYFVLLTFRITDPSTPEAAVHGAPRQGNASPLPGTDAATRGHGSSGMPSSRHQSSVGRRTADAQHPTSALRQHARYCLAGAAERLLFYVQRRNSENRKHFYLPPPPLLSEGSS